MNGEKQNTNEAQYIVSKKANKIDEQQTGGKKKGKNKNKNQNQKNQQQLDEQLRQAQQQIQRQRLRKQQLKRNKNIQEQNIINKINSQEQEKIKKNVKKMVTMFPDHLPSTLQRVYKQQNQNLNQAIGYIAQHVPPDAQNNTVSKQKQELVNNLMFQIANLDQYTENLEISGTQFEELFEQISQMIKDDQSQKGVGVFQINDFIDQCQSAKKAVIVGLRQQLSGEENLDFDENSLIVIQTQEFLWQIAKKAALDYQKRQQDFPTLGGSKNKGSNIKNNSNKNEKSIVQRIKMQNKEQKLRGLSTNFQPEGATVYMQHDFKKSNQHGIYNIDNSYHSQDAMRQLSKQYNNVNLDILAFIYKRFQGDFNACKSFLELYYKDYKSVPIIHKEEKKNIPKNPYHSQKSSRKRSSQIFQKLDSNLMKMSLRQIRNEMEHLLKLRHVFKMTKAKISNSKNRQQLQRLSNQNLPLLKKMSDVSRYKLIEQIRYNDPLRVDLHGYRVDQVDQILQQYIKMIKQEYNNVNSKVISAVNNKRVLCKIVTGKGIHSAKYGMSVLKPAVQQWCQKRGIKFYVDEGSVDISVPL